MSTKRTGTTRYRMLGTVVLMMIAPSLAGCGREGPDEVVEEAEAQADSVPEESPKRRVRVRRAAAESQFAHGPHRDIACRTCHRTVASHATHQELDCVECHGTPVEYATLRVLSESECLDCHHGGDTGLGCADCHEVAPLAGTVKVAALLQLSSWDQPQERELSFDHSWHADIECGECHAATIIHDVSAECGSCHEDHHQTNVTCSRCHEPADEKVHAEAAHAGCGGAGCHQNAVVAAFPPNRPICLSCHADMVDHEAPEKACADCHAIPATWRRSSAGLGGVP